jgi:TorA maturation chaperone TorD
MEKKENEVNLNEIDPTFVISQFKNKERRNNPSSTPRALVPEYEKAKEQEAEQTEEKETTTAAQPEAPREETKRKRSKSPDYEELFIQEAGITARTGKSVYIRKEHHDKIMKIVQVIGKNQVSLFSYIDNVLSQHFATYQDEITELYNKNNQGIF